MKSLRKSRARSLAALLLLATVGNGSSALANKAVPDLPSPDEPAAVPTAELSIVVDPQAKTAVLEIPQRLAGAVPVDAQGRVEPGRGKQGRSRTIIAGVAMSLAAVSLIFVRRASRKGRVATAVVVAGIILAGAVEIARADLAPPNGRRRGIEPAMRVEVRYTKRGEVRLTVPPGYLEKFVGVPQPAR